MPKNLFLTIIARERDENGTITAEQQRQILIEPAPGEEPALAIDDFVVTDLILYVDQVSDDGFTKAEFTNLKERILKGLAQ